MKTMRRAGPGGWVACLVMITACGRVETNSGTGSPAAGAAAAAGDAASAETLVAVSVGEDFACALTASGAVRCWDNRGGQLGSNGAGAYRAVAVPVPGLASGVTAISVGGSSACALTAAGGVQCWGDNGSGQLGSGSTRMSSAVPLPVTGLESGVAAISVGATYACALTTAGGVQCWGMLGIGFDIKIPVVATPAPVAGLESGVAAISVGADSACALSTQGGVQCWGYAHTVHPSYSAVPVPIAGLTAGISAVSVGSQTACALTVGGLVECWGYDRPLAPLGPVAVAGLSSGVAAISVGSGSACALTVGGQVECWGNTSQSGYAYPPIPVTGLASSVTAVSVGQYSTCVVVSDGVECWGLGDPRPVVGLAGPRDAAGTDGGVSGLGDSGNTECADPLTFADPDVDLFVRYAIGIPSGPIHAADVANLTALSLSFPYSPTYTTPPTDIDYVDPPRPYDGLVTSLAGVDCIPSLRSLGVNAFLVDLTPLGRLPKLSLLGFGQAFETSFPPMPQVANLSATVYQNTAKILAAFSSVRVLSLSNADFSTAEARAALSALTNLTMLDLRSAGLTDTTLLAPLSHLADVELSANQIQDLSSLSSLPGLRTLDLSFNQITDLAPLVANLALGYGTAISITDNPPLDCAAQRGNIATLRARGVTVDTDCP